MLQQSITFGKLCLLERLQSKKQSKIISLREITKGLVPRSLSKAATVRALMKELTDADLVRPYIQRIRYKVYWRSECWEIL